MPKMRAHLGVLLLVANWVVFSDAWFWSWAGTTTLAPTLEHEGSGSPTGSGEQLAEDRVGAEIIDERRGIQKLVQDWEETTEASVFTTLIPTTQAETDGAPENDTAETSPLTSQPGNGTSSVNGMGSEGSDQIRITGNAPRHESKLDSESDTGSGLWSGSDLGLESGFAARAETRWGLVFESHGFSEGGQQRADHGGLEKGGDVVSQREEINVKFQKKSWNRTDESHDLSHTVSEQNHDFVVKTSDKSSKARKLNTFFDLMKYSQKNPPKPAGPVRNSQLMEVTELPLGQSAAKETLPSQVLQISHAPFVSKRFNTTQTPTNSQEMPQPGADSERPETVLMTTASQAQGPSSASAASPTAATSQMRHILDATQIPVTEQKLSQGASFSQDATDTALVVESPQCLVLDSALPFCSTMVGQKFAVPNFLNQSRVEEITTLLNEWSWLLKSHCHHSLEWFFCLLLLPSCGSGGPQPARPCRSFCEVLRDSCWTLLDEGHLPVECHTLPDEEDDGYQCLSVSNWKGNQGFERIPVLDLF